MVMTGYNHKRTQLVMKCFDKLPKHLRDWINYNEKINLHDDHIFGGEEEVLRCVLDVELGNIKYVPGNNQN